MTKVWIYCSKRELDLKKRNKALMYVRTCLLHMESNTLREGLAILSAELDIVLNQINLDLFVFSDYCAKRTCDYIDVAEFTDVQSRKIIKRVH